MTYTATNDTMLPTLADVPERQSPPKATNAVVSDQVPNLTVVQLPVTVRAWDNGPLHVQHNDPGRAGKRNRGPEPDKEAPMGTSYSSGVGGQESDSGHVPCDLYRYFDASGTLLYVGISLHAAQRASEHRKDKAWWSDVASMTIQHLPTRSAALKAERVAIVNERPLHNVIHNRTTTTTPSTSNKVESPPIVWLCDVCGGAIRDISTNEEFGYIQVRRPVGKPRGIVEWWEVLHRRCDPNVDSGHYWIDTSRVRTERQMDDWEKHLSSKRWINNTDWMDFMDHALAGLGSRHDPYMWEPNLRVMERRGWK